MPELYRRIARPLLFRLDAEAAQKAAESALRVTPAWKALQGGSGPDDPRLQSHWCGIAVGNPVGLAAGFDKDCRLLPSLATWGFGYMVAGTVTLDPRPGNARPRLFRDPAQQSLTNALGFPGGGLAAAARELAHARDRTAGVPIAASISGTSIHEMAACHRMLEPLVDAVEVNISSPNTAGLRVFHEPAALDELLERLNEGRAKPLVVKLPP